MKSGNAFQAQRSPFMYSCLCMLHKLEEKQFTNTILAAPTRLGLRGYTFKIHQQPARGDCERSVRGDLIAMF